MNAREFRQAAAEGHIAKVESLLKDNKEHINEAGPDSGKTALHWAAQNAHLNVVTALLASDAKINAKDNKGETPLHSVCKIIDGNLQNRIDVIKLMLSKGANPIAEDKSGDTPFMHFIKMFNVFARRESAGQAIPEQNDLNGIFKAMKAFVWQEALSRKHSVQIKPNGAVIFSDPSQPIQMSADELIALKSITVGYVKR